MLLLWFGTNFAFSWKGNQREKKCLGNVDASILGKCDLNNDKEAFWKNIHVKDKSMMHGKQCLWTFGKCCIHFSSKWGRLFWLVLPLCFERWHQKVKKRNVALWFTIDIKHPCWLSFMVYYSILLVRNRRKVKILSREILLRIIWGVGRLGWERANYRRGPQWRVEPKPPTKKSMKRKGEDHGNGGGDWPNISTLPYQHSPWCSDSIELDDDDFNHHVSSSHLNAFPSALLSTHQKLRTKRKRHVWIYETLPKTANCFVASLFQSLSFVFSPLPWTILFNFNANCQPPTVKA